MSTETDQPMAWARRILSSAEPFVAATKRPTVTIAPPIDADVLALTEGLTRVSELLDTPSDDVNHDLLNVIGAIRGYAEILQEDMALLHPALAKTLPALLSCVGSTPLATDTLACCCIPR